MDRLALVLCAALFFALGRYTSAEERRKLRWWLARVAKGDAVLSFGPRRIDLTLPAHWKPEQKR